MTVEKDRAQRSLGRELKGGRIVIGRQDLIPAFAQYLCGFRKAVGKIIQTQNRGHAHTPRNCLRRPRFSANTGSGHSDLDQVEQGLEAHAALEHPDEVVDRESDLLTGLNQPLDRAICAFIVNLAERVKALVKSQRVPPAASL
jgi:hypothetical protein